MLKDGARCRHSRIRSPGRKTLFPAPSSCRSLALCLRRASRAPAMPLYTPAPMPPPLPPPLPRTPLLERSTNKGAGARGESAPVRMKTSLDLYKMRQLVDEQVNVAIRQQQRHYDQYQYRWWTQQTAACVSQNPAMKAPIVPAPKESDKENQRPEVNTAKTLASFPPDQAKRSAPTKNRTPRTAPAPVSRSIWPAPRRATCGEEDPHRSIWSISPFELGLMMIEALREERKKTKKKCSQPAVVGPCVAFGGPTRVVEKATNESRIQEASLPSLHKYYSLPYMGKLATKALPRYMQFVGYRCASSGDSNLRGLFSRDIHSEKPNDADPGIPKSCDAVPQDQTALNYGKIFSLSVDTPVFYPKGGVEDSTEASAARFHLKSVWFLEYLYVCSVGTEETSSSHGLVAGINCLCGFIA